MCPTNDPPLPAEAGPALSPPSPPPAPARPAPGSPLQWGSALLRDDGASTESWVLQGYLAPGCVTLLTSLWKSGKTTLVAVLLARLATGGRLAGLSLAAGRAVIVSEEHKRHWQLRDQVLHFGDHLGWALRPFKGAKPTPEQWQDFVAQLRADHERQPFVLLVIDPLADFLAGSENDAACVLRFLKPLQDLTERGVAVLIVHHPGKEERPAGLAARGSGALSGAADILIEMSGYPGAADDDRRRRLQAFSRFADTPRQLVLAWSADGTDYENLGSFVEGEFVGSWRLLRAVLAEASRKLNRHEINKAWPEGEVRPARSTLQRWLKQAVERGLVTQDGEGTKDKPYRYWLPERVPVWMQDPFAQLHMPELFTRPAWMTPRKAAAAPPPADPPPPAECAPAPVVSNSPSPLLGEGLHPHIYPSPPRGEG